MPLVALYGYALSFKVFPRMGGQVPDINAISGPQLTAEAQLSWSVGARCDNFQITLFHCQKEQNV